MMFLRSETGVTSKVKTAWPGETLRDLLDRTAILDQPAVCDPLSARLAREARYEAVNLGGYAIGAHLPLTSELSLDDIEQAARAVIRACGLPLLLDADIGWGGIEDLPAAVVRLEAAGVAAIQLASQHVPAQVPFSPAAERERAHADLTDRVRTARAAREHVLVMARCAIAPGGSYREAVGQARDLLESGADAILVQAGGDELRQFARDLPGATLICAGSPAPGCGQTIPARLLEQWGYSALSRQYYRCYCARMQRPSGANFPVLARPGRTGTARPGRSDTKCREDLERKQ
jgi:2-methylisocitrate lyase-like PEP mutase family enzyme